MGRTRNEMHGLKAARGGSTRKRSGRGWGGEWREMFKLNGYRGFMQIRANSREIE